MGKVLITGGTGFIGKQLSAFLKNKGYEVWVLSRQPKDRTNKILHWNPAKGEIDDLDVESFDSIIHLAGEGVADKLWTTERKKQLVSSRVDSTKLLVDALKKCEKPPGVLLSSSGTGIYGDRGDELLDESSALGEGFLSELAKKWEQEALACEAIGTRVVLLRTGLVLGSKGGLFNKLLPMFKLGLGGSLSNGEQYMSWLHIEDYMRAAHFLLQKEHIKGPVNMVSPSPLTNYEFTKVLGRKLGRPTFFRVPKFFLGLLPGEMAAEIFLASQKCIPKELSDSDFTFKFVSIESAVDSLLNKQQ